MRRAVLADEAAAPVRVDALTRHGVPEESLHLLGCLDQPLHLRELVPSERTHALRHRSGL
jgi:hypothetical protein